MVEQRRNRIARGHLARGLVEAVFGRCGLPSGAELADAFDVEEDVVGDGILRLIERSRSAEGRATLEALLAHENDARLIAYVRQVLENAEVDAGPGRAYFRALRNHVAKLVEDLSNLPSPGDEPARLHVDGTIRRERVAAALANALGRPELAGIRALTASTTTRPEAVRELTEHLAKRYPSDLQDLAPGADGLDEDRGENDAAQDGHDPAEAERALRRKLDAPKRASKIAVALGDDLALVLMKLGGKTLEDISRRTGIPRSTVADRLDRARDCLGNLERPHDSYGTASIALSLLLADRRAAPLFPPPAAPDEEETT